jgi:hypothetical protein
MTAGCRADPKTPSTSASPSASAAGKTQGYKVPANPCDGVAPSTAAKAGLTYSDKRSTPLYVPGPQNLPVSASIDTCTWTFPNPAHGRNGRPNQFSATVGYTVIDPKLDNAAELAKMIFKTIAELRNNKDVTVVREASSPVPADEGSYLYVTEKSVTGAGSKVEVLIRRANAVVQVSFSGADLTLDPKLPKGLQLVTTPVDEARLRPTVELILPDALALLES